MLVGPYARNSHSCIFFPIGQKEAPIYIIICASLIFVLERTSLVVASSHIQNQWIRLGWWQSVMDFSEILIASQHGPLLRCGAECASRDRVRGNERLEVRDSGMCDIIGSRWIINKSIGCPKRQVFHRSDVRWSQRYHPSNQLLLHSKEKRKPVN